jgi:hypothetical protein
MQPQTVLFAVLDWGMGHATRTSPLIAAARDAGHTIHVASRGTALAWLRERFAEGDIAFHEKPGRHISYAERFNFLHIARQMPGFLRSIAEERSWTAEFAAAHDVDRVFSDNCYGVWAPGVPSILMTHQLHLPVPLPLRRAARAAVRRWSVPFEEVWVPDLEGLAALSGPLGHPALSKDRTYYVGPLSHLATGATPGDDESAFLAVGMVSGPEPHRTLMEEGLRRWLAEVPGEHVIFAGKPGGGERRDGNVWTRYSAPPEAILGVWRSSQFCVSRAGYSTVLDLVCEGKPAVLIPTPGQTEQLEVAAHLAHDPSFLACSQRDLLTGRMPSLQRLQQLPQRKPLEANVRAQQRLLAWLGSSQRSAAPPADVSLQNGRR